MNDEKNGERLFTDGVIRPVFLDNHHRQYVIDDDGERVYGIWIYREEDHPDYLPIPSCKTTNV
ncbi:MAG TPA: hypothetical protein VFE62_16755 [Gemmataceae bacterium]|nr:hypothetical protein [Gemmataceae bacterium]